MVDRNGHALTVGMVVKLECTITAIDDSATHYDGVVVRATYPAYSNPDPNATGVAVPAVNVKNTGPVGSNPQLPAKFAFDGTQLTYVSG